MNLDQEECKDRFELYEKRHGRTSYQLAGVKSEKKGYFHKEVNEYGKFELKATKIPRGFKKVTQKRKDKYVHDWACKNRKTKKQKN